VTETLTPYNLPEAANERLFSLAAGSDLLLIGELHGTQEVPRVLLGLLPHLVPLGYGGLALEMPADQRDQLLRCAQGDASPPPLFGPSDFRDGRGNAQALRLVRRAVADGWRLLCFDMAFRKAGDPWSARDAGMAQNLREQWERHCPGRKVLGVCGNYHSRLAPPTEPTDLWPSFAYAFQQLRPDLAVRSVNVTFGRGAFFNGEVRTFDNGPEYSAAQPEVRPPGWAGHTMDLYLPHATPATFLDT